jgi:NRAMP (natural resistance-associated macrophage protein)-like metal ion transporter
MTDEKGEQKRSKFFSIKRFGKSLGPGVITGASDDDPSGIATYSQAGAKFGLGLLWMALFQLPMMIVVQEMCARIGLVTGKGLGKVIRDRYSYKVAYPLSTLLLIANTINIGADIGAMAASTKLVVPDIPIVLATFIFSALIISAEILIPYEKYVRLLKYLTISLFAYVPTAIIVGGNFAQIFLATIIPHIGFTPSYAMMFVAIFGTTISPYLFYWQASEEAEEDVAKHKIKEIGEGRPDISKKEIMTMKKDVAAGMLFSQLITRVIMITTAGSLHMNGITDIQTADQAAQALEPLVKAFPYSGELSKVIFALGIIGTGLLAVPVLAGSSAYALSETFGWKEGLGKQFGKAKSFYLVIISSTIIGLGIALSNTDPILALIYAAVINGIVAVPILFIILKISNDKTILANRTNSLFSRIVGWMTFTFMAISVIAFLILTWNQS